jgi:CheY-like chemotaxis protein
MNVLNVLHDLASNKTILIVEDNEKLRIQLKNFLERFFPKVFQATDGEEGLEVYKKNKPDLIMTDIQMPSVNGLEMVKKIHEIDSKTPIIVMSAYDQKEYLFEAIKVGVMNYLKKPSKLNELSKVIIEVLQTIKKDNETRMFDRYANDLFEKQNSLILLFEQNIPVIANPAFLQYFGVDNLTQFQEKYIDLGVHFLKQDNFLYNADEDWFDKVLKQSGTYFHVKMVDREEKNRHFLLKYLKISDYDGYGLVTLDDITDLNLLALFNIEEDDSESKFFGDRETIKKVLLLLKRENIEVKVYNFYKGLSVTNKAKIISTDDGVVMLKTNYHQLRASKYENSVIIGSETLPNFLWCDKILQLDFNEQVIRVSNIKFMKRNPTNRKNIRLVPEPDYKISLFFKLKEFLGKVSIVDISIDGMKIKVNSLLVGMRDDEPVEVHMTLARKGENSSFEISAKILRIDKYQDEYYVIILFDLDYEDKQRLIQYISKRQMQLIREFKSLE